MILPSLHFSRFKNRETALCQVTQFLADQAYVRVLVAAPEADPAFIPARRWALYRLGCYRRVVEIGCEPFSPSDRLARGVSLAACGQSSDAEADLVRLDPLTDRSLYIEACQRVAAFDIRLAVRLCERLDDNELLKAAIHHASGDDQRALELLGRVSPGHLDLLLLQANVDPTKGPPLDALNRFLAGHKLSSVALRDAEGPLNCINLMPTSNARKGSVRGPLTSVIMTTYNSSERVNASIMSILDQSYRDIELIVVDDGSDDDTPAIIMRHAQNDARIRIILRSTNAGTYVAKNQGLRAAKGRFVTCHDSDDFAHQERTARQVLRLLRNQSLISSQSDLVRLTDDGRFVARQVFPLTRANTASLLFIRRPVLARAGFYEEVRTGADSEFVYRLKLVFGKASALRIKRPLTFAAHREGSLTTDEIAGINRGPMPNDRLGYWEGWTSKHIEWRRDRWPRWIGRYYS